MLKALILDLCTSGADPIQTNRTVRGLTIRVLPSLARAGGSERRFAEWQSEGGKLVDEIGSFIGAHDTLVGLVVALVGAIVTLLGTVVIERWKIAREAKRDQLKASQDEARSSRIDLAHYMNEMATHCEAMAIELDRYEIPHSHGHAFNGLLEGFGDLFKPYLSTEVIKLIERMREVSHNATEYDADLYDAKDYNSLYTETKPRIKQFIIDAKRLAGDLRDAAERIRATAGRALVDRTTSLSRRKS